MQYILFSYQYMLHSVTSFFRSYCLSSGTTNQNPGAPGLYGFASYVSICSGSSSHSCTTRTVMQDCKIDIKMKANMIVLFIINTIVRPSR